MAINFEIGTEFWSISKPIDHRGEDTMPVKPWLGYVKQLRTGQVLAADVIRISDRTMAYLETGEYFKTEAQAWVAYYQRLRSHREFLLDRIEAIDRELKLAER
jgi:hypothetical protein